MYSDKKRFVQMVEYVMHFAKNLCPNKVVFDQFNITCLGKNIKIAESLGFIPSKDLASFYLYNYKIASDYMNSKKNMAPLM